MNKINNNEYTKSNIKQEPSHQNTHKGGLNDAFNHFNQFQNKEQGKPNYKDYNNKFNNQNREYNGSSSYYKGGGGNKPFSNQYNNQRNQKRGGMQGGGYNREERQPYNKYKADKPHFHNSNYKCDDDSKPNFNNNNFNHSNINSNNNPHINPINNNSTPTYTEKKLGKYKERGEREENEELKARPTQIQSNKNPFFGGGGGHNIPPKNNFNTKNFEDSKKSSTIVGGGGHFKKKNDGYNIPITNCLSIDEKKRLDHEIEPEKEDNNDLKKPVFISNGEVLSEEAATVAQVFKNGETTPNENQNEKKDDVAPPKFVFTEKPKVEIKLVNEDVSKFIN